MGEKPKVIEGWALKNAGHRCQGRAGPFRPSSLIIESMKFGGREKNRSCTVQANGLIFGTAGT